MLLPQFNSFEDLANALILAGGKLRPVPGGGILTMSQALEHRPLLVWLRIVAENSGLRLTTEDVSENGAISFSSTYPLAMEDALYRWRGRYNYFMDYSDALLMVWLTSSLAGGQQKDGSLVMAGPTMDAGGYSGAARALLSVGGVGTSLDAKGRLCVSAEGTVGLKAWLSPRVSKEVWAPGEAVQERKGKNRNTIGK